VRFSQPIHPAPHSIPEPEITHHQPEAIVQARINPKRDEAATTRSIKIKHHQPDQAPSTQNAKRLKY